MGKQPHAALPLPVQGAEKVPAGSGTLMNTENDVSGEILGGSTSTSPSSTKEDEEAKPSSSEPKVMDLDSAKLQMNILNESEPSGRSSDGGMDSADIDQPGSAVDSARMQADRRPGEDELLPGVQAPRECLSPRRQVDMQGLVSRLAAC